MIRRIGCRAHDYGKDSIEVLSKKMADDGYTTTQLALKKALKGVSDYQGILTQTFAKSNRAVMLASGVDVSVLGAYSNYCHPEDKIRSQHIEVLKDHLRIANSIGARMVGTETGSLDQDYKAHPDNYGEFAFQRFKEAILEVMPLVHEEHTFMAIEGVAHHVLHTPSRVKRLIDEVKDERLKVIFDISNLVTIDNWHKQEKMIHQMFDSLESSIIAVHVKDFDFVKGKKVIVPLGQGRLALDTLMEKVIESHEDIDVLAENIMVDNLSKTYKVLAEYLT